MDALLEALAPFWPFAVGLVALLALVFALRLVLGDSHEQEQGHRFRNQVVRLLVAAAGIAVLIGLLPLPDELRGQLFALFGVLLSGALALSSTNILGNAMAGIMLRARRNFRPGDFIQVGDYFGRVSEQSLVHTEIQTEDRDLLTVPNLWLVSRPVKVMHESGTVVSAKLSLGYDVPVAHVEAALKMAATDIGLEEPFVHVTELGDFSVGYRVSGLLREVKQIVSTRSRLRRACLEALHGSGIEIVSPNFMTTRAMDASDAVMPQVASPEKVVEDKAEEIMFDKAEEAGEVEDLAERSAEIAQEIEELQAQIKKTAKGEREPLEARLAQLELRREYLEQEIKERREKAD